jgi:hypothetical protein
MDGLLPRTPARRRLLAAGLAVALAAAAMAVLAAVSLNTRTAVGAGGGGGCPAPGPVCTFKNHVAFADFTTVQTFAGGGGGGGGCIATDAFVQAFESLTMPGKVSMTTAIVSLSTFNFCTGAQLECASNFDPNTGAPLFSGTVQFGLDLTTATVSGTAAMFDPCTGASFTTSIDVTWQAFGPNTNFIDSSHFRAPGFVMNSHFMGVSSEALASGVLTDASGSNRASAPTINADLENDSGGTVAISHS